MSRKKVLIAFNTTEPVSAGTDYTAVLKTEDWKTESDVIKAVQKLEYDYELIGIYDSFAELDARIQDYSPDIIFNLIERFKNDPAYDLHIASHFELLGSAYTGCSPEGMTLCKSKSLSKKILSYHRISVPDFHVFEPGKSVRKPRALDFPVFVKPLTDEGSLGISNASFVEDSGQLSERVEYIHHSFGQPAIAEEYVEGRELYVGLIGNKESNLRCLPPREMCFGQIPKDGPRFASYKAKWDEKYRKRWGITNRTAKLSDETAARIERTCKRIYRLLEISGYARLDLRLTPEGKIVFIEANPNPMLAAEEDFALAASKSGLSYPKLIDKIIDLGLRRHRNDL